MCRICKFFSPRTFLARVYLDLSQIDEFIKPELIWRRHPLTIFEKAVLALEDRRYFTHCGIDTRSAFREIWRWMTLRRHGGASTIEMQFVRTCTGYRKYKLSRKLYESLLAYLMTLRHDKITILRAYLDIVYLGHGLKGAEYSSQRLFTQRVDSLDLSSACQLAAMMVYPKPINPQPIWHEKVQRRASYAERLIQRLKIESPDEE